MKAHGRRENSQNKTKKEHSRAENGSTTGAQRGKTQSSRRPGTEG